MENYTRIIGATSTNIRTPTSGEINQGNVQLTPYDSAKNNGYYNEMSEQLGNVSTELTTLISAAGLTPDATLGQVLEAIPLIATPITTQGDIIRGDATGKAERLALGTIGQILQSNGADINWVTPVLPTIQKFLSGSGTYTTPAGVKYINVKMVGGGGGGAGSGQSGQSAGSAGADSTFGTSLLTAGAGGGGGIIGNAGGIGGSATINSPAIGGGYTGGTGQGHGFNNVSNGCSMLGGSGAATIFGGSGGGATYAATGQSAKTNSGSGGGGGGTNTNNAGNYSGSGGGAAASIDAIINSPDATYAYAVGAAGAAGSAGTQGHNGGAGGSGYIEVTEYY